VTELHSSGDVPRLHLRTSVNGKPVVREIEPRLLLLDFLRDDLGLKGAKRSCDVQVCGTCTVLLDGLPVSACTTLAYEAMDRQLLTIEGLSADGELHPLQAAFIDHSALQCGFCTPGMILAAKSLLDEQPNPTRADMQAYFKGNLCRCTGYYYILDAVAEAAETLAGRARG